MLSDEWNAERNQGFGIQSFGITIFLCCENGS